MIETDEGIQLSDKDKLDIESIVVNAVERIRSSVSKHSSNSHGKPDVITRIEDYINARKNKDSSIMFKFTDQEKILLKGIIEKEHPPKHGCALPKISFTDLLNDRLRFMQAHL